MNDKEKLYIAESLKLLRNNTAKTYTSEERKLLRVGFNKCIKFIDKLETVKIKKSKITMSAKDEENMLIDCGILPKKSIIQNINDELKELKPEQLELLYTDLLLINALPVLEANND